MQLYILEDDPSYAFNSDPIENIGNSSFIIFYFLSASPIVNQSNSHCFILKIFEVIMVRPQYNVQITAIFESTVHGWTILDAPLN